MTVGARILTWLAIAAAAFAGVVGAWGGYLLAVAGDDALGINGVLGRAALATSAVYVLVAVGVLLLVRRRRA